MAMKYQDIPRFLKKIKRPTTPPDERKIKFFATRPMKLMNSVSSKSNTVKTKECLNEMFEMMACLKQNEFDEPNCDKEIQKFQNCNKKYVKRLELEGDSGKLGELIPGSKSLSSKQATALLKKFPS